MSIAVIPARGGSKRIPRKNIREFCGKPMIAWSIEAALKSGLFEEVIVSTDDDEIASVAKQFGAKVPFNRPKELSDDFATTGDVMQHAAQMLETRKALCCIYATAPFVQINDLKTGLDLLINQHLPQPWDYVFSATHFAFPIQRALRKLEDQSVCMFEPDNQMKRSQDLEPAFHDAGQFYWGSSLAFAEKRPIFSSRSTIVELPNWRVQDIDTTDDWKRAEAMFLALGLDKK